MLTVITNMKDMDMDKTIFKGVNICLICLVFLANFSLAVIRIARNGCSGVLYKARYTIQISLALGGIGSALFYNVIQTIVLYDMTDHGLNCKTTYLASVYFYLCIPMVYCIGLILLALDLILRFKTAMYKSLSKSRVYPILCAIIPWVVAIAVTCPLTLMEIEWDLKCANMMTTRDIQTAVIVCIIAPAGLVLFLAIGVAVVVQPQKTYSFQQGFDSPMYAINDVTNDESNTDIRNGSVKKLNGSSNGNTSSPQRQISVISSCDENENENYPSFSHNQGKMASREKWKLLVSMVIVALNVLPYSCICMYITTEYSSLSPVAFLYMIEYDPFIAYYCCSYLLNLYPLIIPLFWIFSQY